MRDILSKVMAGSMIAGAALLVAACGSSENNTAANTTDNGLGNVAPLETENLSDPMMGGDNGLTNALDNASESLDNAQESIENATEAAQ